MRPKFSLSLTDSVLQMYNSCRDIGNQRLDLHNGNLIVTRLLRKYRGKDESGKQQRQQQEKIRNSTKWNVLIADDVSHASEELEGGFDCEDGDVHAFFGGQT